MFPRRRAAAVAAIVMAAAAFVPAPGYGITADAKSVLANILTRLRGEKLPEGIVKTNGRIEATQVDISAKYPGRLVEVKAEEGDNVKEGEVVARIASPEIEAQLKGAKSALQRSKQALAEAEAQIAARTSTLTLAKAEIERTRELLKKGFATQQAFDERQRNFDAADANKQSAEAQRNQAESSIKSAEAEVERIEAVLHDLVLVAPRSGRIQYQLARAGEVVAPGARVFTILDLKDVYMTVFLPSADAGKLEMGGEARVVLDPAPQFVIPAKVSFVAADAQFTPKSVETSEEREKLMFRVKLQIDRAVLERFHKKVKTGVRGMGIVRTNAATAWPEDLQVKLPQ